MPGSHELLRSALVDASNLYGEGAVLSVLQGLIKSHVLRVESTMHGLFVKMHYCTNNRVDTSIKRTLTLDLLVPPPTVSKYSPSRMPPPPTYSPPPTPVIVEDDWRAWIADNNDVMRTESSNVENAISVDSTERVHRPSDFNPG